MEKIRSKISQFAPFDDDQTFREKVVYDQKMVGMFESLNMELLEKFVAAKKNLYSRHTSHHR